MNKPVERQHWLSALVGVLDAAWNLTAEEQYHVLRIMSVILDELDIPDRGFPHEIPVPLALEVDGGFYSSQVYDAAMATVERPVKQLTRRDQTAPVEAWRSALLEMFLVAYPNLDGVERMWLSRVLSDLLAGIGVANRAPVWLPEDVVRVGSHL